jgi:hypothetical protein
MIFHETLKWKMWNVEKRKDVNNILLHFLCRYTGPFSPIYFVDFVFLNRQ